LQHQSGVSRGAFSPGGQTVRTASGDNAQLWETATGKPLGLPLKHLARVMAVAFSPDGKTVLTGSEDKTARLWHAPRPVEGDAERILLWAQVITGFEMDEYGGTRGLDAATWEQRRQRLQELGGPPVE
jgi:WD40 repeat protein